MNSTPLLQRAQAHRLAVGAAIVLLACTLTACGGGNGSSTPTTPTTPTDPAKPTDPAVKPEMRCAP